MMDQDYVARISADLLKHFCTFDEPQPSVRDRSSFLDHDLWDDLCTGVARESTKLFCIIDKPHRMGERLAGTEDTDHDSERLKRLYFFRNESHPMEETCLEILTYDKWSERLPSNPAFSRARRFYKVIVTRVTRSVLTESTEIKQSYHVFDNAQSSTARRDVHKREHALAIMRILHMAMGSNTTWNLLTRRNW
eukprot:760284-Hanusia_phi.AAC.2